MATGQGQADWSAIRASGGSYPQAAFDFVREGLAVTVARLHADESLPELARHVTGQQLCLGLRDHALERWGMLAPTVLDSWNIHRTDDFGRIVFALIEHGQLSKTPQDTLEDFRAVYDFDEAFATSAVVERFATP